MKFGVFRALFLLIFTSFALAYSIGDSAFTEMIGRMKLVEFASDKTDILREYTAAERFTSAQVITVLAQFKFSTDKLKVLAMFSNKVTDLSNISKIADSFAFAADQAKAAQMTAGWTLPAVAASLSHSAGASQTIKALAKQLAAPKFSKDKLKLFRNTLATLGEMLNGDDILLILGAFDFSADRVEALRLLGDYTSGITCAEAALILRKIPFSKDRLALLRVIKDWIIDTGDVHSLTAAFEFESDKIEAWKILKTVKPVSLMFGIVKKSPAVFVIDFSGSMTVKFKAGGVQLTRLDYVLNELETALTNLPPGMTFNVVAFHTEVVPWAAAPLPASKINLQSAVAFMRQVSPEGGTAIYDALEYAYSQNPQAIYFLTDGIPTHGTKTAAADILADVKKWHAANPCPIYAIAFLMGEFGGDNKNASKSFLKQLSEITGGVFRVME
jgi:hypothetical protein